MINNTHMTTALARRNRVGVAQHLESKRLSPNPSEMIVELAAVSVQGIIVLGEQNVEFCNKRARELTGVPKSVLAEGVPWIQFLEYQKDRGDFGQGETAQGHVDGFIANFKKRQVMQVELMVEDGRIIRSDRIPNSIGGMTLTMTDISELKAREAELTEISRIAQTAEKAKSDFLANMSHEMRTPLNGVLGMAEVLGASDLSPEQREAADVILASAEALVSVVEDVLEVSRLDLGQLSVEVEPFDLSVLVTNLVAEYAAAASAADVELRLRLADEMPNVVGDGRLLRQAVLHVLDNAIRFTQKGQVDVIVKCDDAGTDKDGADKVAVSLIVRDTGIGIEEKHLGEIFERFKQIDSKVLRSQSGSGLGLSLAKSYADLIGGQIETQSVFGEGSTFSINVTLARTDRDAKQGAQKM